MARAHNFVFCNWLVMSPPEKVIRIILEAGLLKQCPKNQETNVLRIYEAYLYGTVEEYVMFTLG